MTYCQWCGDQCLVTGPRTMITYSLTYPLVYQMNNSPIFNYNGTVIGAYLIRVSNLQFSAAISLPMRSGLAFRSRHSFSWGRQAILMDTVGTRDLPPYELYRNEITKRVERLFVYQGYTTPTSMPFFIPMEFGIAHCDNNTTLSQDRCIWREMQISVVTGWHPQEELS